jgi:hypothetical protein
MANYFSIIIVVNIEENVVYYQNFTFDIPPTFSIFIIAYALCIEYLQKDDALRLDTLVDPEAHPRKRLAVMGIHDLSLKEKISSEWYYMARNPYVVVAIEIFKRNRMLVGSDLREVGPFEYYSDEEY